MSEPVSVTGSVTAADRASESVEAFDAATPKTSNRQGRLRRPPLLGVTEKYGVSIALVVAFVAFSIALPTTFFTTGNITAMINSQAIILPLAMAASVPLRSGDFDLSIGGVMAASAALVAQLSTHGVSLGVAILASVFMGLVTGTINAVLVVKIGVDPFVSTLGMMTALDGAAFAFTNNNVIVNLPHSLLALSRTEFLGFPADVWFGWALVLVGWYVYECTPLGRYLLFIGGSREVTRLTGLRVDRYRTGAFITCSLLSALVGVFLAGNLGQVDPAVGGQYLLQPFAGVFLGATTITVGRVNAFGTLIALYLLTVGITGLQLLGSQPWLSDVFNGAALALAVTFARLAARRNAART